MKGPHHADLLRGCAGQGHGLVKVTEPFCLTLSLNAGLTAQAFTEGRERLVQLHCLETTGD